MYLEDAKFITVAVSAASAFLLFWDVVTGGDFFFILDFALADNSASESMIVNFVRTLQSKHNSSKWKYITMVVSKVEETYRLFPFLAILDKFKIITIPLQAWGLVNSPNYNWYFSPEQFRRISLVYKVCSV